LADSTQTETKLEQMREDILDGLSGRWMTDAVKYPPTPQTEAALAIKERLLGNRKAPSPHSVSVELSEDSAKKFGALAARMERASGQPVSLEQAASLAISAWMAQASDQDLDTHAKQAPSFKPSKPSSI
jgi:predicted transcriptional regulator